MDLRSLCNAFGGSIFPEELRGNYRFIWQLLHTLERTSEHDSPSTMLLQALYCIHQGQHSNAVTKLTALRALAIHGTISARWELRGLSYTLMNVVLCHFPPYLRMSWSIRDPVHWMHCASSHLMKSLRTVIEEGEQLRPAASVLDALEWDVMLALCKVSLGVADIETVQNFDLFSGTNPFRVMVSRRELSFENIAETAKGASMPEISRYIGLLELELKRFSSTPNYHDKLLQTFVSEVNDATRLNAAGHAIAIGDRILAGLGQSPLFLNLDSESGLNSGSFFEPIERRGFEENLLVASFLQHRPDEEPQSSFRDVALFEPDTLQRIVDGGSPKIPTTSQIQAALPFYEYAELEFKTHGAKRGMIAIILRRISILKMKSMDPAYVYSRSRAYLDQLGVLFQAAQTLVEETQDEIQGKILLLYRILSLEESSVAAAEKLGIWMCENSAHTLGNLMCILALQWGHWFRYGCGWHEAASTGYRIANSISFTNTPFIIVWFRTSVAISHLALAFGDVSEARRQLILMSTSFSALTAICRDTSDAEEGSTYSSQRVLFELSLESLSICIKLLSQPKGFTKEDSMLAYRCLGQLNEAARTAEEFLEVKQSKACVEFFMQRHDWLAGLESGSKTSITEFLQQHFTELHNPELLKNGNASISVFNHIVARVETLVELDQFPTAQELSQHYMNILCRWKVLSDMLDQEISWSDFTTSLTSMNSQELAWLFQSAETCMCLCLQIRDWSTAARFANLIGHICPGYFWSVWAPSDIWPWQRRLWMGLILESVGKLGDAFESYGQASALLLCGHPPGYDMDQMRSIFDIPEASRASASLARICLRCRQGEFQPPDIRTYDAEIAQTASAALRREKKPITRQVFAYQLQQATADAAAITWLEADRARYLHSMLGFDGSAHSTDMEDAWRQAFRRERTWTALFSSVRSATEEIEFQELSQQYSVFTQHLDEHWYVGRAAMHRLKNFFAGHETLPPVGRSGTIAIYTCLSEDGLGLWCIDNDGIQYSGWNGEHSISAVRYYVSTYLGLINRYKEKVPKEELQRISYALSDMIIKPIESLVRQSTSVIFVPSGDLVRFPLPTLILDRRYLGLSKTVTQIPSLTFLYAHLQRTFPSQAFKVKPIAKPGTMRQELMPGGESRLPMGGVEALFIARLFGAGKPLDAGKLGPEEFRAELQENDIVHVCTHGRFVSQDPLRSFISLKTPFRILDLIDVRTNAATVIFSTCFSNSGYVVSSEDVMGFGHAILATGVKSYIGSLWKTNDVVTLLHMGYLYAGMATGSGRLFQDIWADSVRAVASMDAIHAKGFLESMIGIWDSLDQASLAPDAFVRGGRKRLQDAIDELMDHDGECLIDFSHPYFWAPFALTGYSSWKWTAWTPTSGP